MADCLEFVRKGPTDPGGIMFCRRCGLHIEVHAGPQESTVADDTPDPELDRIADMIEQDVRMPHNREVWTADERATYDAGRSFTEGALAAGRVRAVRLAAAVLADLRARYILVPRDGAIVEMRLKGAATVLDPAVAAMLARPGDEFERRDVGPWEAAP